MKHLGIDFGSKRVGLAVSDADGRIAFPRGVLPNGEDTLADIADIVAKERIARIVVGDARAFSGAENAVTPEADAFCAALAVRVSVPVERAREAWSSFEAARFAPKGREHDDAAAAAILLQRYLDIGGVQ